MAAIALRRFLRGDRAAELLEFALALPILLLVLGGILDMGFLFKDYEVITNAAREGARMAALPGWDETDVRARIAAYLAAGGFQGTATTTITAGRDRRRRRPFDQRRQDRRRRSSRTT